MTARFAAFPAATSLPWGEAMLLVIDYGNTNGVFAVYDGETLVGQWRCASDARRTTDEYAVWLTQLLQVAGLAPHDIEAVALSNVVPAAERALRELCRRYLNCEPVSVRDAMPSAGIEIRMSRPDQVGADRIANAMAAHAAYSGPMIIVDFGTATTFDVIDPDGAYSGGVIAPGINLSLEALYLAAARLPRITVERPAQVVGDDTVSAMQSGVFWGYIGLIEGVIARIDQERARRHTVVATGGLAPLFETVTDHIHHVDLDLTLRGVRLLYEAYRAKAA